MSHNNSNSPDKDTLFLRSLVKTCKEHGYVLWENVAGANTSRRQRLLAKGFISFKGTSALKEVITTPLAEAFLDEKPVFSGKDAFVLPHVLVCYVPRDENNINHSKVDVLFGPRVGEKVQVLYILAETNIFLIPTGRVNGGSYVEDHFALVSFDGKQAWTTVSSLVGAY